MYDFIFRELGWRIFVLFSSSLNELIDFEKRPKKKVLYLGWVLKNSMTLSARVFFYYILSKFDFSNKWRAWMRASVFLENLAILVDGSLAEEIKKTHLPFLFLLVVEELNGLLRWTVGLDLLSRFRIASSDLFVSHLQYVDNTLIIRESLDHQNYL